MADFPLNRDKMESDEGGEGVKVDEGADMELRPKCEQKDPKTRPFDVIICIEVGTGSINLAYSRTNEETIHQCFSREKHSNNKCPSVMQLNKFSLEVEEFGSSPHNFVMMNRIRKDSKYFYIVNLKDKLQKMKIGKDGDNGDFTIETTDGVSVSALLVIQKLFEYCLVELRALIPNYDDLRVKFEYTIREDALQQVEQIVYEAAINAGLFKENDPEGNYFQIVFEQVASGIHLIKTLEPKRGVFLCADLGAGSLDVIILKGESIDDLREVHYPKSFDCGSRNWEKKVIERLNIACNGEITEGLKGYLDCMDSLERAKKCCSAGPREAQFYASDDLLLQLKKFENQLRQKDEITIDDRTVTIPAKVIGQIWQEVCMEFIENIDSVVQSCKETITNIFLSGGGVNAIPIQEATLQAFGLMQVIAEPAFATLYGAIHLGKLKRPISNTKSLFNIGGIFAEHFSPIKHDKKFSVYAHKDGPSVYAFDSMLNKHENLNSSLQFTIYPNVAGQKVVGTNIVILKRLLSEGEHVPESDPELLAVNRIDCKLKRGAKKCVLRVSVSQTMEVKVNINESINVENAECTYVLQTSSSIAGRERHLKVLRHHDKPNIVPRFSKIQRHPKYKDLDPSVYHPDDLKELQESYVSPRGSQPCLLQVHNHTLYDLYRKAERENAVHHMMYLLNVYERSLAFVDDGSTPWCTIEPKVEDEDCVIIEHVPEENFPSESETESDEDEDMKHGDPKMKRSYSQMSSHAASSSSSSSSASSSSSLPSHPKKKQKKDAIDSRDVPITSEMVLWNLERVIDLDWSKRRLKANRFFVWDDEAEPPTFGLAKLKGRGENGYEFEWINNKRNDRFVTTTVESRRVMLQKCSVELYLDQLV